MPADPLELILVLDGLADSVRNWTRAFVSVSEEALAAARQIDAAISDLRVAAVAFEADARDNLATAETVLSDAHRAATEAADTYTRAEQTEKIGQGVLSRVNALGSSWQGELQKATDELSRADEEERRARAEEADARNEEDRAQVEEKAARGELSIAQENVSVAQHRYERACHALSACRGSYTFDESGNRVYKTCHGEAAEVNSASSALGRAKSTLHQVEIRLSQAVAWVSRATHRVGEAVAWVSRAVARVQRAQRRVALCRSRLDRVNILRGETSSQLSRSVDALRVAHDAVETGADARTAGGIGRDHSISAVAHAEASLTAVAEAVRAAAEITTGSHDAATAAERQIEHRGRSIDELDEIKDALRRFDSSTGL